MAQPYVGELRIFAGNFPPSGWMLCDGQLLPISENETLFQLIGTTYGGNGKSTFALPDMQGSAPMHPGQGPGLSLHDLGERGGSETVTLLVSEIPNHTHTLRASVEDGTQGTLATGVTLSTSVGGALYHSSTGTNLASMSPQALTISGGGLPHNNMQPYLTLYFCIALQGVFPARP